MTNISRRGFARTLAASAFALPFVAAAPEIAPAVSSGPLARLPVTASYQTGRFEVTVISDGYIDFAYDLFTGATPDQVKQATRAVYAAGENGVRAGFSTYLINDGARIILVDSGPAGRFASINDQPIRESERKFHWQQGPRPADHPGLSNLGL